MPNLARMLQVRREMGITFVPYARFWVQTRHSPEECAARLQAVTQPQKLPTLFSARTSPEAHLLLKGRVMQTGFLAVPVDNKCPRGSSEYDVRGAQPFWLRGRFQPAFGGTDIVVQVFPNFSGMLTGGLLLSMMLGCTLLFGKMLLSPDVYGRGMGIVAAPMCLLTALFLVAAMTLSSSFQAYKMKNALRQLLSE